MKIVAVIQARMGSTRLSGKMMMVMADKPVVAHVFERVRAAKKIDQVCLATTSSPADDILAHWAQKHNVTCFRGSESDVLDRYYQAAKQLNADIVVRVTGDCPLADPAVIDKIVDVYTQGNFDYVSNTITPTFPDGLDVEVFSFAALEQAWREAALLSEREHVTPYIWKHPELFQLFNITYQMSGVQTDLSSYRWTLDTAEDLELIQRLLQALPDKSNFSLGQTLTVYTSHPDWQGINAQFERNEGYQKSLKQDNGRGAA